MRIISDSCFSCPLSPSLPFTLSRLTCTIPRTHAAHTHHPSSRRLTFKWDFVNLAAGKFLSSPHPLWRELSWQPPLAFPVQAQNPVCWSQRAIHCKQHSHGDVRCQLPVPILSLVGVPGRKQVLGSKPWREKLAPLFKINNKIKGNSFRQLWSTIEVCISDNRKYSQEFYCYWIVSNLREERWLCTWI